MFYLRCRRWQRFKILMQTWLNSHGALCLDRPLPPHFSFTINAIIRPIKNPPM
jgi:hypothetical protein